MPLDYSLAFAVKLEEYSIGCIPPWKHKGFIALVIIIAFSILNSTVYEFFKPGFKMEESSMSSMPSISQCMSLICAFVQATLLVFLQATLWQRVRQ